MFEIYCKEKEMSSESVREEESNREEKIVFAFLRETGEEGFIKERLERGREPSREERVEQLLEKVHKIQKEIQELKDN